MTAALVDFFFLASDADAANAAAAAASAVLVVVLTVVVVVGVVVVAEVVVLVVVVLTVVVVPVVSVSVVTVFVVAVTVVTVVPRHSSAARDAASSAHGAHAWSDFAVATTLTYSRPRHGVKAVHSRSLEPCTGGLVSYCVGGQGSEVLHAKSFTRDAEPSTTYSSAPHLVECAAHSFSEWLGSDRNVPSAHGVQPFVLESRNSPAEHNLAVVTVVAVVVVVVLAMVLVVTVVVVTVVSVVNVVVASVVVACFAK